MRTKTIALSALAAIALTACCTNENEPVNNNDGRVALQVTSGIQSRAIDNNWQAKDAIGIYMLETGTTTILEDASNRRYTTSDGNSGFTATADQVIYFPVSGADVDFIAYYPQQTLTAGSMTINVSNQTELPKIDLMAAKALSSEATKAYNKSNPNVTFNFSHKLTKIELNIAHGTGLTDENLKGLTVEITNQRTQASYAPLTETLTLNTDQTPQAVTFNTAADGLTAEAILLPNSNEFNPIISGRQLVFTLKATGEKFYYAIPDGKLFKAGERNIYTITINRTGLQVTAKIEDWAYGNGDNGETGDAN